MELSFDYKLTNDVYFLGKYDTGIVLKPKKITISNYLPPIMFQLFKMVMKKNMDKYLICPFSENRTFQIGITGTFQFKEDRRDAMIREISEESRLLCNDPDFLITHSTHLKNWYLGSYTKYEFIESNVILEEQDESLDDVKNKIGALIWVDPEEFINHPSINLINSDKIVGLGLIHAKDIDLIIKHFLNKSIF